MTSAQLKSRLFSTDMTSLSLSGVLVTVAITASVIAGGVIALDVRLLPLLFVPVGLWALIWGIRSQIWFPVILVFVLGFEQFTLAEDSHILTFSKVGGVVLVATYCLARWRKQPRLIRSFRQIPMQFILQLLMVFWFAVTSLWSVRTDTAAAAMSTFGLLIALTWLVADFVISPRSVVYFANAIVSYGLVLAVLAMWQYQDSLAIVLQGSTNFPRCQH